MTTPLSSLSSSDDDTAGCTRETEGRTVEHPLLGTCNPDIVVVSSSEFFVQDRVAGNSEIVVIFPSSAGVDWGVLLLE